MKLKRPAAILALMALISFIANVASVSLSQNKFSSSFPTVVCPPTPGGTNTTISMPTSKVPIRVTGTKSLTFVPAQALRYLQSKAPVIVESQGVTPVVWQIRNSVWAGATICSAPQSNQWFVGGSADVTSQGRLMMINSGLSAAIIEVQVWNEIGPLNSTSFTLKANSSKEVGLDALAPGANSLVVRTVTRAGRVTSYLVDERGRGLRALGGDLINFAPTASREIFIPAIPHFVEKKKGKQIAREHSLRLLVPGDLDSNVTVEIFSLDGRFIPAGLENKLIKNGRVFNLELSPKLPAGKFGVRITSDEPVLASVYSPTIAEGKNDFIWSTAAPELKVFTAAISGLSPTLSFIGDAISIDAELRFTNDKSKKIQIRGEDIAIYRVPDGVRSISFKKVGKQIYGAGLISSKSGYGYFPLAQGSVLTKSSIPMSNIRVLTP